MARKLDINDINAHKRIVEQARKELRARMGKTAREIGVDEKTREIIRRRMP